ncbi:MAG TPA: hypothetical protein VF081_07660 [Solirubrobacterales bacterium]
MLCALLVSAFAAQSASAITGTTAFTCVKGQGTLRGEHCQATGSAAAEYGHVKISQDNTTEVTATNDKTESETTKARVSRLKLTIAGIQLELSATGISGSGSIENLLAANGEHYVHGNGTITFTGVKVTKPEGRGCKVYTDNEGAGTEGEEGVVHTRELTATTEAQGDALNFRAADSGDFARFFLTCEEGKKIPALEGTWSCNGSVKGVPNGATTEFTHTETTTQNTLKCKNMKVGIDGGLTLSGREKDSTDAYTPLSPTTVTTGEEGTPGKFTGTTAFTCTKGKGTLRGEHCLTTGSAAAEYGHVQVAQDETTELTGTNAKTANSTAESTGAKLKLTIGGIPLELQAIGVGATGWLENKKTASGEHYAAGEGTITFTGVTVKEPAGKGCEVTTHKEDGSGSPGEEGEVGVIHTRKLKATTEGQGDFVNLQAADGGNFANFWITCAAEPKIPAIEGTWSCNGSVKGVPTGATTTFTHTETTTQNTLKCKETKAGIEAQLTLSGREKGSGGGYTPLAATTK